MKRLSSLQRKMGAGFEELKRFVHEHEALIQDTSLHKAIEGNWEKTRRRIADFENFCKELEDLESRTGQGAVELYWQAKVNALERQLARIDLDGKEAEFLGKAACEVGKQLHKLIPAEKLSKLMDTRQNDSDVLRAWSKQAESNVQLLQKLSSVEAQDAETQRQSVYWSIAVENALAAVSLVQLEEAIFQDTLKDWRLLDDHLLKMGWTMETLARIEEAALGVEEKLASLHIDCDVVARISEQVQKSRFLPHQSSESAALLQKCSLITQKYFNLAAAEPHSDA